ncbi:hypothetical protein RIF29_38068 [Crotalaria pallida]|uniref:Uncharacterized protein n=1 Tax=Crotalaria pallida TaxID=3830 RepID=A0AAN9DZA0_CROPI
MDVKMCTVLFGDRNDMDWEFLQSNARSVGVINICRKSKFEKKVVISRPGFIVVQGEWKVGMVPCCVVNVCSPCSLGERITQWQELMFVRNQLGASCETGDLDPLQLARRKKLLCDFWKLLRS